MELVNKKAEQKIDFYIPDGYEAVIKREGYIELVKCQTEEEQEPKIKDKKVRKLVRDWADINGIKEVDYVILGDGLSVFGYEDMEINFTFQVEGVHDDKRYTITELCGEEE